MNRVGEQKSSPMGCLRSNHLFSVIPIDPPPSVTTEDSCGLAEVRCHFTEWLVDLL